MRAVRCATNVLTGPILPLPPERTLPWLQRSGGTRRGASRAEQDLPHKQFVRVYP